MIGSNMLSSRDDMGYRNYTPEVTAPMAKQQPPLDRALEDLDKDIAVLGEHLTALEQQLHPVLRYEEPVAAGDKIPNSENVSSPLLSSLRDKHRRINNLIDVLSDLRARVLL